MDAKPLDEWWQVHRQAENVTKCLEGIDTCEAAVARTAEVYHLAADMGGMGFIASQRALLKSALRA